MHGAWSAIGVTAVSLAALTVLGQTTAAQVPEPGTYRVWLCASACTPADSARAVGIATIVIVDDATASSDAVRSVFSTLRSTDRGYDSVTVLNACYRIIHREGQVGAEELHFGIQPKGTTRWHYSATDGFSLGVYRSADAGYSLRWREPGVLTRGEGWSYGWATNVPSHRNAYFAAIRVGEPDVTQCT